MSMLLTCFGTVFLSPERFLNFAVFICYSSFKYPIAVVNNLIFALHISFFFFFASGNWQTTQWLLRVLYCLMVLNIVRISHFSKKKKGEGSKFSHKWEGFIKQKEFFWKMLISLIFILTNSFTLYKLHISNHFHSSHLHYFYQFLCVSQERTQPYSVV